MTTETNVTTETQTEAETRDTVMTVPGESLRQTVVRGVGWELGGQFGMQFWRFLSNWALTRLLVPEAFGLLGIVQVFMMALTLLSDIGLRSSVIHDQRAEQRNYLDTVWTVSVIRGFLMWIGTCLLARPFASFFDMPELVVLLPVTGLSAIARGFASTSLLTASRNLRTEWYVRVEFGSQIIGTTLTVLLAFWLRSALALALGWIVTAIAYTVLSYWRHDIPMNRFCWDREIVKSLSRFGRWALASGGFTIIQQRGDRLALGKIVSTGVLGNYVIGSNLALLPMTVFFRLTQAVLQPLYARVRDLPAAVARSKIRRLRFALVASHTLVLTLLVILAQPLVDLIYEGEYRLAGWYCSLAALACLVRVGTEMGPVHLAHGDSWTHFKITAARTFTLVIAMVVGYFIGSAGGQPANGVLYGVIVGPLLAYPYQAALYQQVNAWLPEIDMIAIVPAGLLILGRACGAY